MFIEKKWRFFISSVIVLFFAITGSVEGQSLLYKRGDYALNVGLNHVFYNAKGSVTGNDATDVYFGGTVAGTIDLAVNISQATGIDKTVYGFSGEIFPIKEKELGLPFTVSIALGYANDGENLSSYAAGAVIYKSVHVSDKVALFPFAGGSFTEYSDDRYTREGFFSFGLPGAIQLEKSSCLILQAGLAIGREANSISLGFQISFGL